MLQVLDFVATLRENNVEFFSGVPDSLLKEFCAYIADPANGLNHQAAANEGSAVAMAAGYHLATGTPTCVYMQNSGQGNAVNPLVSLVDPEVYSIPMVLVIGWRGEMVDETQIHDEPQHVKQGQITTGLLSTLDIPYVVVDKDVADIQNTVSALIKLAMDEERCVAIVIRKNTFQPVKGSGSKTQNLEMSREDAIQLIARSLDADVPVVATTGKASRELYEYREEQGIGLGRDFLTVGSMGHASQIAAGIAIARPGKRVACLDGDGAVLMHMGGLATTAKCENIIHILLNNLTHDTVGGQETSGTHVDFCAVAKACGYVHVDTVSTPTNLAAAMKNISQHAGSVFLEVKVRTGARSELGRPKNKPVENKKAFMAQLSMSGEN